MRIRWVTVSGVHRGRQKIQGEVALDGQRPSNGCICIDVCPKADRGHGGNGGFHLINRGLCRVYTALSRRPSLRFRGDSGHAEVRIGQKAGAEHEHLRAPMAGRNLQRARPCILGTKYPSERLAFVCIECVGTALFDYVVDLRHEEALCNASKRRLLKSHPILFQFQRLGISCLGILCPVKKEEAKLPPTDVADCADYPTTPPTRCVPRATCTLRPTCQPNPPLIR